MAVVLILLLVAVLVFGALTGFGFRLRFKPTRSKLFIAGVTYAVSFLSVTIVSFLSVMFIAGPHSGVLEPGIWSHITVLTGLLTVLVIPIVAVYASLRRLGNGGHAT